MFINYAVWESTEHFKRAFANPEFQSKLKEYPSSAVGSAHLFRRVAVPESAWLDSGFCEDVLTLMSSLRASAHCSPGTEMFGRTRRTSVYNSAHPGGQQ